jgi:hypothetical protein
LRSDGASKLLSDGHLSRSAWRDGVEFVTPPHR